jgi:hypothetical protein
MHADVAIQNALDNPEILAALSAYGYDEAALQAGADLLATAQARHRQQQDEYAEQYSATEALNAAREAAAEVYSEHLTLARIAFREDGERYRFLQLDQRRKRTFSGWVEQAQSFYARLLETPGVLDALLARFPLDQAAFEAARDDIEALTDLNLAQENEKHEAQEATKTRDAALDALDVWLFDYRRVAEIALKAHPQQLEALNFGAIP